MFRRSLSRAALLLAALLVVIDVAGVFDRGARVALGIVVFVAVLRIGLAMFAPMQVGEKSYEPVDAIEPGQIPVYACKGCGTQLVLLRKGSDKPPRHCGEAMTLRLVADDLDASAVVVPDYPPADL